MRKMIEKYRMVFLLLIGFLMPFSAVLSQDFNEILGSESGTDNAGTNITTGDRNVILGDSAGSVLTTASGSVLIGYGAGLNSNASQNVFIGENAGLSNTSYGIDNVFIGPNAGESNTNGDDNVFIGAHAGQNSNGNDNTFIGATAGENNTTGNRNVFLGEVAGNSNTTASDNTFLGQSAGRFTTTGEGNTFVGGDADPDLEDTIYDAYYIENDVAAGFYNETGNFNTFFGAGAGLDSRDVNSNTFVGYAAGCNTEDAGECTFVGAFAGWDNNRMGGTTEGQRNNYLGFAAGGTNQYGNDNIVIGWNADFENAGTSGGFNNRNIFIGNNTEIDGADDLVLVGYNGNINNSGGTSPHYSIGIGSEVTIDDSPNAIAMGYETSITDASDAIGIGHQVQITAPQSIAIGSGSSVSGTNSTVIGYQVALSTDNEIFLGNSITASIGGPINWTATSDGRYKKDILENVVGLDFINRLRPVTYQFDLRKLSQHYGFVTKDGPFAIGEKASKVYSGFIAQEVAEAAREADYDFSGIKYPQHEQDAYGLRYASFYIPLVKAVQELSDKLDNQDQHLFKQMKIINKAERQIQKVDQLEARLNVLDRN